MLIALAVLGVIAAFTIPKVLQAQQNGHWNAATKEAMGTLTQALEIVRLKGNLKASTMIDDLSPYFNYVKLSTLPIDSGWGGVTENCTSFCYVFHSGGVLRCLSGLTFGGTSPLHAIHCRFDPDGKVTTDGSLYSPGKSIFLNLYYNGRITTGGNAFPGTTGSGYPSADPDWFRWN